MVYNLDNADFDGNEFDDPADELGVDEVINRNFFSNFLNINNF